MQGNSSSDIRVRLAIIPPDGTNQSIELEVKEISFFSQKPLPQNAKNICTHTLHVMLLGGSKVWSGSDIHRFLSEKEICKPISSETLFDDSVLYSASLYDRDDDSFTLSEPLFLENDPFYYPYDGFDIQLGAFVIVRFTDENGNQIEEKPLVPELMIDSQGGQDWDRTEETSPYNDFWDVWSIGSFQVGDTLTIKVTDDLYLPLIKNELQEPPILFFFRPIIIRVIFPIIIFSFLVLLLLITLSDSLELFFSGATAILVGFFGIRAVLIPATMQTRTLVDISIMGLYVVFALSILLQVVKFLPHFFQLKTDKPLSPDQLETIIKETPVELPATISISPPKAKTPKSLLALIFLIVTGIVGWFIYNKDK